MIFKHLLALLFMLAISAPLLGQDLANVVAGDVIDNNTSIPDGAVINLNGGTIASGCLLYTSPSPRDQRGYRMPSSA